MDDYIYIINVRFAGEIHYNADVDEKLLQTAVPSMILQPIVENCIKHGLRDVEWEKKIDLSVYSEGDSTVISVRDNGVGIPDAVIERILNNKLNEDDSEKMQGGVGLDNVITRLRVFYDRENVIEITSVEKDMGTEIALYIPR